MIKVIKGKELRQKTCANCRSLLSYEREDIRHKEIYMNEFVDYIICPECNKTIQVD